MSRLRSLQVTPLYIVTIAAVYVAIDPARRSAVVYANSTNVANLLHGQWYTLLTSAVLLAGRDCLPVLLLVGVVIGIGELTIGRSGVIGVFWYGHVVASLLVFAALATGTSLHELCQRLAGAPDVGPSYGAVAVLGCLLVHRALRHPATWQITAVLLALAATALHRTFTDVGHLTALMLGLVAGYGRQAVHRRRDGPLRSAVPTASPSSTPRSPEPLACGVSSGPGEVTRAGRLCWSGGARRRVPRDAEQEDEGEAEWRRPPGGNAVAGAENPVRAVAIVSADAQVCDRGGIGERFGQWTQRPGVGDTPDEGGDSCGAVRRRVARLTVTEPCELETAQTTPAATEPANQELPAPPPPTSWGQSQNPGPTRDTEIPTTTVPEKDDSGGG